MIDGVIMRRQWTSGGVIQKSNLSIRSGSKYTGTTAYLRNSGSSPSTTSALFSSPQEKSKTLR
uniref:Uncharacterized protein n=1 Tax=Triticum urartu TaxID=4572 RepID=A0A8R7V7R4_TRIUA